jgi:hypothetical protein
MRPGDAAGDPILALARALVAGDTNKGVGLPELAGKQTSADELAAHLASGGDPSFLFIKALRDLADAERARSAMLAHEQARLVLLVDQLEELFVRPEITTSQRVLFTRLLTGLARSGLVWVIATMRSDWRHRVDELKDLRDLAEGGGRLALLPPSPAQLLEMIRQPVRTSGLEFEKDPDSGLFLDALLVQEAGTDPGVLPHLSVLLDNLYRRDIHDGDSAGLLTVASYRSLVPAAMGGLRSSIGHHAERVIKELESADPEAAHVLPRLLRALIGGGKSGAETNRPVLRSTFPEQGSEQRLIEVLLAPNARLLTAEDRGDGAEIRLAHEALIQNWPRARTIITESANFLRVRDELEAQRRKWQAAHRRGEFLLARGLPLAEAESLVGKFSDEVSPHVRAFVKASRARANRGQMIAWGVAMVFASIACGALWQWRLATQAAKLRIGTDVREKLARAAFLVESSDRGALATAFPVGSHMLATAAHVVDSIASVAPGEKLFIRSPGQNGKTYEIVNYKVHPGSVALRNVVSGDAARRAAAQLDLDGYDFGLLYVKEELPAEARLEIAPPSELKMLQPGAVIAMAGYPVEGISGSRSQVLGPTPELHMGSITSFTDFFFLPAEFANAKLIHHDLPAVGGGSGSPIVSYTGHIVGMLTGGNTYSPGGDQPRAPSAALVNYAHRADVLQNLMQGSADAEVATDRSYWEEQLRKFRSGPDIIADLIRREIVAKDKNLTLTRLTELTEVLNTQSQAADSSGGVQRQSRRTVRTPAGADYLIVAYAYDRTALTVSVQNGDQVVGESRRHSYFSSVRVQTLVEGVLTVSINCSCDRDIRYSFQVLSVQPSR